jgi:hypothetical protein
LCIEPLGSRILLSAGPLDPAPTDHTVTRDLQDARAILTQPHVTVEALAPADSEGAPDSAWAPVSADSQVAQALKAQLLSLPADLTPQVTLQDVNGDGLPEVCVNLGPDLKMFVKLTFDQGAAVPSALGDGPVRVKALGFSFDVSGVDHLLVLKFDRPDDRDSPDRPDAMLFSADRHHENDSADLAASALLPASPLVTVGNLERQAALAADATSETMPVLLVARGAEVAARLARPEADDLAAGPTGQPPGPPTAEIDRSTSLLTQAGLDLPEATADLVPLAKANLAVVPAFVVGDAVQLTEPPAELGTAHDLALSSFVIGLDELPSSGPDRTAAIDRVFSEGCPPPQASGNDGEAAYSPPAESATGEATPPTDSPLRDLALRCRAWLADLCRRDDRILLLAQALLAVALVVLSSWRLTRRTATVPGAEPKPRSCTEPGA